MRRARTLHIVCLGTFLLVLALLASPHVARAQWVDTHSHEAHAFAVSSPNLLACYVNLYRTPDDGVSWTQANSGLNGDARRLATVGPSLLAGTWGAGVYRSTDQGTNWTAANTGLTNPWINAFAVGSNVFAATQGGGVFRSPDGGLTWIPTGLSSGDCIALLINGANLFVGGFDAGGVSRSTNNGVSWTAANTGLTNHNVTCFAVMGTTLFAGTDVDNGTNWTAVNSGLINHRVISLAVSGSCLIAGTYLGGAYLSADNGATWGRFGLSGQSVWALIVKDA